MSLDFFGVLFGGEPSVILKLFLNIEGVKMSEHQKIVQILNVFLHIKAKTKWRRVLSMLSIMKKLSDGSLCMPHVGAEKK